MTPRIVKMAAKKLIGYNLTMSLANNQTGQLWGSFGPRIKEIENRVGIDLISMQVYDASYYQQFNPANEFEKWATVEVENFDCVPNGMKTFNLDEGTYVVFDYKGSSADPSIFQYIFWEWLPKSPYQIADRPHFEILGSKYKNNDPNSEEEIWVPIVEKALANKKGKASV